MGSFQSSAEEIIRKFFSLDLLGRRKLKYEWSCA
jgi:hypothetical protein